jgi:hypothetical protein
LRNKERIYNHLIEYKNTELKISQNGLYRNNKYGHILPKGEEDKNFITCYRDEIINYVKENHLKLHRNFHHLNSSQILAFNFIIPFIIENQVDKLLQGFDLSELNYRVAELERIENHIEGTNFDFYIELESNQKIYVEIKYTEDNFGVAKLDESHREKYTHVYKDKLAGLIKSQYNNVENVLKNYQLMRNTSYLNCSNKDLFIMVYPKWNNSSDKSAKAFIDNMITENVSGLIKIIYWEDLINNAIKIINIDKYPRLHNSLLEIDRKYFQIT